MTKNDIMVTQSSLGGRQVLFCSKNSPGKKPLLFLFHRLLQSKEFELPFAYYLAESGYFVILMDFPGHGDGEEGFFKQGQYDFNSLFENIVVSVSRVKESIGNLREANPAPGHIDMDRIGIVGVSLGGMVALTAGYMLEEISFVVSVISCARWYELVQKGTFDAFRFFSTTKEVMNAAKAKKVIDVYDPYYHVEEYGNKPLLLVSGLMDRTFPAVLVEPFFQELERHYKKNDNPERICWKAYYKNGHELTYDMIRDTINWLNKWSK
ncbi:MAG: alpha/beta fold hydrolase [bacterium]|nr:alpha/beta fold hydrolase [bacterium]